MPLRNGTHGKSVLVPLALDLTLFAGAATKQVERFSRAFSTLTRAQAAPNGDVYPCICIEKNALYDLQVDDENDQDDNDVMSLSRNSLPPGRDAAPQWVPLEDYDRLQQKYDQVCSM